MLLLAACGGASSSARPTSSDPTERLLLTLEWFEDRACACTDRSCAEALDDEIAETLKGIEVPRLFEDEGATKRADAAMQRTIRCAWKHGVVSFGFAKIGLGIAQAYQQRMC